MAGIDHCGIMKDIFKGYYKLDNEAFKVLWEKALFIFDTNVLLNLYRYQSSTRDALLQVMEKLKGRVWIPYHVGLEFQRNRIKVIAEQHKRFSEVKEIVEKSISGMKNDLAGLQLKKRHSHINPDELIKNCEKIQTDFNEGLSKLEQKSISINSEDEIRERIDALFRDNIGRPPPDQKMLDELFSEGEERYKNNIPPGYKDSSKDEKSPDEFTYSGLTYKGKYGDLIIWKQIVSYALSGKCKNIIFVTDDTKADWWQKIESNGSKTLGVRPELTDEIHREAGVERFHVYNTEGFLSYANKQLDAQVADETIEEVREISDERHRNVVPFHFNRDTAFSAESVVHKWLNQNYPNIDKHLHGPPQFVGFWEGRRHGFDIKFVRQPRSFVGRFREMVDRYRNDLIEGRFHEITWILVVFDEEQLHELEYLIKRQNLEIPVVLRIIIGEAKYEEEGYVYEFIPYTDFILG
jgi:PIN domain-containing protein